MGINIIHSLCVSASVPLIAIKHCCLWVSSTLRICAHCRMPFYIAPPFRVHKSIIGIHSCLSFSVEPQILVLTATDFVEYRLLLCSRITHAKLLTCYSYMMATRILWRSQSVLCCCTPMTSPLLSVYASCSSSRRYTSLLYIKLNHR